MRATKFKDRISIVRPTLAQDEAGELVVQSTTTLFTCWARIEPLNGIKRLELLRNGFSAPKKITINKRLDYSVESTDLVYINSVEYQISDLYDTEDEFFTIIEVNK